MRENEVRKTSSFLKSGVHCLALYKEKDDEKEMLQCFSQMLAIMEPRDLMDMFSLCMSELFQRMITNTQLLQIFSTLLQAPKVFRPLTDVLINFLMSSKLDALKQPDTPVAKLVLQLFRLLFGAVSEAPKDREAVLQPYIPVILEVCMKNSTEVDKPLGYLHLLRLMFWSFIGKKYEVLLRDLIPLLQSCLHMLLSLMEGPSGDDMRDLLIELCLTLPARLSALLPHLPRLVKPLVSALKGSDDLVTLGLRTLELWIDNVNPDFLEPTMANVISEVLLALWSHLRPHPYPWGAKALQLLGKLGGWNRRFLKEPLMLECKENPEHGLCLILTFDPSTPILLPLDRCIYLAVSAVMQNSGSMDAFYRKQALKLLRVCLACLLNLQGNITSVGVATSLLGSSLVSSVDPLQCCTEPSDLKIDLGVKTKTQLMAEKSVFKTLLTAIIAASAYQELEEPKDDFVVNLCRHFAMLFHVDSSSNSCLTTGQHVGSLKASGSMGSRSNDSTSNLKELDPLIFLDALVDVLANQNRTHAKAALIALNVFSETLLVLERAKYAGVLNSRGGTLMPVSDPLMNLVYSPSVRIPVFEQLLPRLLHCCYGNTWHAQIGGVMGLGELVGKVSVETLRVFQVTIVRGLIYVLKRLPMHSNKEQEETSQVLNRVLRAVNTVDEANNESCRQSFHGVVEVLAVELFNPNASIIVRRNVQSCLALLASQTGSEVSELLEPLYQPLLLPFIMRPLRSKNIEQQVNQSIGGFGTRTETLLRRLAVALAEVERSEVPAVLQRIRQPISFTVQRAKAEGFLMREETFSAPDSLGGFGAGEANGAHRRGERGQRCRRANFEVEAPLVAAVAITKAPNTKDVVCASANEVRVFSGDASGGEICVRGGVAAKDIELTDCFCSVVRNDPAPSLHPRLWGRGGYGQSARAVEGVDGRATGIMGVELQQDLSSGLAGEGVKDEEAAGVGGCRNL